MEKEMNNMKRTEKIGGEDENGETDKIRWMCGWKGGKYEEKQKNARR